MSTVLRGFVSLTSKRTPPLFFILLAFPPERLADKPFFHLTLGLLSLDLAAVVLREVESEITTATNGFDAYNYINLTDDYPFIRKRVTQSAIAYGFKPLTPNPTVIKDITLSPPPSAIPLQSLEGRGVGSTVACESALRSAGTLLSPVRAPPPAPWPDGGPESLRSPCSNPQQDDLRLSGPPSGRGAGGGARTRDRRVPADLRADLLTTLLPTPHKEIEKDLVYVHIASPQRVDLRLSGLRQAKMSVACSNLLEQKDPCEFQGGLASQVYKCSPCAKGLSMSKSANKELASTSSVQIKN
ncbi:hypothetical protein PoB_005271900 [Plakobranchus ocellatus]|uniref:Uncharacterized protein n=1 Tax=Plakobranchus ocellatus TaxID=259542 RepID=A0AAV4C520_9GAST|nr:hypothetical protein PoB_005271900 [Plakobranchus ocellatus]